MPPKTKDANWSEENVREWEGRFRALLDWCNSVSMPTSVIEATMRDTLAQVEAQRLLGALRTNGAKI